MPMDNEPHRRIDEGIPRGPRQVQPLQPNPDTAEAKGPNARAGALSHVTDAELIQRIADGAHGSKLADELGVEKSAIYHRFRDNPAYQIARRYGAEVRLESSEREIQEATDPFTLSRARERFRAVAWRAEREHADRWGVKQQLTGPDGGPVQVQIVQFAGVLIEGQVVDKTVDK